MSSDDVASSMVFVDLETTGSIASVDRITEIGIVELDAQGHLTTWSSLVNPQVPIPRFIQGLTGITDEMVVHAPTFADLAEEVLSRLQGRLFVAHNARFDYSFLQQAFLREQRSFSATVLCTVRLSRKLYPQFTKHSLDALIARHGLQVPARHRALADAQVLAQFWRVLQADQSSDALRQAVDELTGRQQWPAHLDIAMLATLPEQHGAYVLYGAEDEPLYVGKGANLRQQVLAHFNADLKASAARRHVHLVRRIASHPASGELGAALLKASLIQRLSPAHNRTGRESKGAAPCTWRMVATDQGDEAGVKLSLCDARDLTWRPEERAYGLFGTRRDALKTLREIAEGAQLCLLTLGVEDSLAGQPIGQACKALSQSQCSGVCMGRESLRDHSLRAQRVLADWRVPPWPHEGPVKLKEGQSWHVLDAWRYLGTAQDDAEVAALLAAQPRPDFDRDTYKVIAAALQQVAVLPIGFVQG